jgi:hypothetical protein
MFFMDLMSVILIILHYYKSLIKYYYSNLNYQYIDEFLSLNFLKNSFDF